MNAIWIIAKRELNAYFSTPIAYIFLFIFVAFSAMAAFYLGAWFQRGQADLQSFFVFHPWLYLILVPALTMRLWAEERRTGTIELTLTLPFSIRQWVIGKFLASWLFAGLALVLTFPMWITVSYLGDPDHGVIVASYLGSWAMSGAFLAIGSAISAFTKNQVVAFVLALVVCLLFVASGFPLVLDVFYGWAPTWLVDADAGLSFLTHFTTLSKGILAVSDVFYFVLVILVWLILTELAIDWKKAH